MDPISTIVAAYLAHRQDDMSLNELQDLILTTRRGLDADISEQKPKHAAMKTAQEVKASIKPGGLVSFEDGGTYKTLKRHLTTLGMTPEQYREKHGLPVDYPMVSREYSKRRSQLAKTMGLGLRRSA